jgi:hypothetical protein
MTQYFTPGGPNPIEDLKVSLGKDGESFQLLEDVYVFFPTVKVNWTLTLHIPEGFGTNFASVPKFWQGVFSPLGRYWLAALVHDYLYDTYPIHTYSRKFCDGVFLEVMRLLGVGRATRYPLYWSVRLFGASYWRSQ